MTRDKSSYFKEISGWKLDAKLEDVIDTSI